MKTFFLLSFILSFYVIKAQTILFQENFNGLTSPSLPTGWTSTGNGGWKSGTPAELGIGFNGALPDAGVLAVYEYENDFTYLNEVVTTPNIDCSTAPANNLFAFFDLAFSKIIYDSTESLKILASTDNGASWTLIQDFGGSVDFGIHRKYINLSAYAGQSNLKLSFCYSDHGDWLNGAVIDNFTVQVLPDNNVMLEAVSPGIGQNTLYAVPNADVIVKGAIFNAGNDPITKCVFNYQQGLLPIKADTITGLNVLPLEVDTLFHSIPFVPTATGDYPMEIWIDVLGDVIHTNDTLPAMVKCVPSLPLKRLVFEESTGTWCGYCVRGTMIMDRFVNEYPGMAAQIAVHSDDPMAINAYDSCMLHWISGYPSILFNREKVLIDDNMNNAYNQHKNDFGYAYITLGNINIVGDQVSIPVTFEPVVTITDPNVILVITESNVTGPLNNENWAQANGYSGMAGDWGGFENQPMVIYNMRYHFVARSITPYPFGDPLNLPETIVSGQTYNVTVSATLDTSWNRDNLQYIIMLINGQDSTVLNSNFTSLPVLQPLFTSILNIEIPSDEISIYPNPADKMLNVVFENQADSKYDATMSIRDASGRKVSPDQKEKSHPGVNHFELNTEDLPNGIYFIMIETKDAVSVQRVMISH